MFGRRSNRSNRPRNSTGETDLSRRRRMAKARASAQPKPPTKSNKERSYSVSKGSKAEPRQSPGVTTTKPGPKKDEPRSYAAQRRSKNPATKAMMQRHDAAARAAERRANRPEAVSKYKEALKSGEKGASMPTPSRRRSSFGGGSSQPPRPAPQRSSAAPQTASRGPMAPMDAVRRSQQQSRSGGTPLPSGRAAGMMRGAVDMNRSNARGTGTPAPNMPAPPGLDMNRREAYQPRRGAPMPGGRGMKEGGEVKKLSLGGGIAKRGTGKNRMC